MQPFDTVGSEHPGSKTQLSTYRRFTEIVLGPLLGFMLLLVISPPVYADNFYVDNEGDGVGSCATPKNCTVRAALRASEGDSNQSYIHLPNGSYRLKTALPPITTQITIKGSGSEGTSVSGPCLTNVRQQSTGHCVPFVEGFRVFEVAATGKLMLNDLTVRGGAGVDGAGILNRGSVWLERVTVMGNFTHNGAGGIANLDRGRLSLNNSTVRENFSHHGPAGGILNDTGGRVDITNSTVSDNQVVVGDGGVEGGNGGGIVNQGVIAITASTISGNSGVTMFTESAHNGVGGILNLGAVSLNGVSIAGNKGGFMNDAAGGVKNVRGTVSFGNTIIAGNHGGNDDCFGDLMSLRGNLVGRLGYGQNGKYPCNVKDSSSLPATTPVKPADVLGERQGVPLHWNVFVAPGEEEFRWLNSGTPVLRNNGGPTCTHALCTTASCFSGVNWARNKGWQNVPSTYPLACSPADQRGVPRNSCDSGAFETVSASPPFNPDLVCSSITLGR